MDTPNGMWFLCMRSIAASAFSKCPAPRRPSLASSKPSMLTETMKLPTRLSSSQKAWSMSVPFVKAWKAMSRCFSHRRKMSALRMSGSPPVKRQAWVPSSAPSVSTRSISSKVRFCLWPYSAAQQPAQRILQALVGSMRTIHGMLQSYFSEFARACWKPRKPPS